LRIPLDLVGERAIGDVKRFRDGRFTFAADNFSVGPGLRQAVCGPALRAFNQAIGRAHNSQAIQIERQKCACPSIGGG
jgi:hypothetical protein